MSTESTAWSLIDEGSSNLTVGSWPESPVNFYSQAMPGTFAMQATESTCTPSPRTDQNQSEAEIGHVETTKDVAIHACGTEELMMASGVAGGLQDLELHDTVSAFDVKTGLKLEGLPPGAVCGDQTPSFYDSPRCYSDDSMDFPATPDASFGLPDFHGPGDPDYSTAGSSVPPASVVSLGTSGQLAQAAAAAAASSPTPAPGLVLVQVPVQVHNSAQSLPFNASVAVLSQEMDAKTGAVALEMRLVLSPPGTNPEVTRSSDMPRSQQRPQQCARFFPLSRARSSPGAVAAGKRDVVCCHWKAKGWCKYGASCKFEHPTGQRGQCGVAHSDVDGGGGSIA